MITAPRLIPWSIRADIASLFRGERNDCHRDFSLTTIRLTPASFHSPVRRQIVGKPPHRPAAPSCPHTPSSRLVRSGFSIVDILRWPTRQRLFWNSAPPESRCARYGKDLIPDMTDNGCSRATRHHRFSAPILGTDLWHRLVAHRRCQSLVLAR